MFFFALCIRIYLHNRNQYIKLSGWESHTYIVHSGNHLGPLLFILFINDVVKCFKYSKCSSFADDLKLFKSVKKVHDSSDLLRDLDTLLLWCQRNRLFLNFEKCKWMSLHCRKYAIQFNYMIDTVTINRVTSIRDQDIL